MEVIYSLRKLRLFAPHYAIISVFNQYILVCWPLIKLNIVTVGIPIQKYILRSAYGTHANSGLF